MGEYSYSTTAEVLGEEVTTTYSIEFDFDGKAHVSVGKVSTEYNYKLDGNHVIFSADEEFGNADDWDMLINSVYQLGDYVNLIGLWTIIGVGILALALVVTIPNKR